MLEEKCYQNEGGKTVLVFTLNFYGTNGFVA